MRVLRATPRRAVAQWVLNRGALSSRALSRWAVSPWAVRNDPLYRIRSDYVRRKRPKYYDDFATDAVWQPDVYHEVASIAREQGCRRIVDLGCGTARKLVELQPHYDIVGVDYGSNIAFCRAAYDWGKWIAHDLDSAAPLPLTAADLKGSVIVAADVIEHLQRPERLLAALRLALRHATAVVLSTPERDLTWGAGHRGPPPNECHVQEWNQEELRRFLADEGLDDARLELTRSSDIDRSLCTVMAIVPAG